MILTLSVNAEPLTSASSNNFSSLGIKMFSADEAEYATGLKLLLNYVSITEGSEMF
jgi:hypothetical protein